MLSNKSIDYFKKNWYTFEEIQWIEKGILESKEWKIISKSDMKKIVLEDLFSKYTVNV
jgi:hypothetical protein